jgi:hypothetical protein
MIRNTKNYYYYYSVRVLECQQQRAYDRQTLIDIYIEQKQVNRKLDTHYQNSLLYRGSVLKRDIVFAENVQ